MAEVAPRGPGHIGKVGIAAVALALFLVAVPPAAQAPNPPAFTSLSPDGGEFLAGGSTFTIRWNVTHGNDPTLFTTLAYSTDGGSTYRNVIAQGNFSTNGAAHAWTVPMLNTSAARVQVCAVASDMSQGCRASAGNFTIDSTPPRIVQTYPIAGATNVSLSTTIVVTFSEPMDRQKASWTIVPTVLVTPQWSTDSSTLFLAPSPTMSYQPCTTYTVRITGTDRAGNLLVPGNVPNPWSFTTQCQTSGQVQLVSPVGGERWTGGSDHLIVWIQYPPPPGAAGPWELSWRMNGTDPWRFIANGTGTTGTQQYLWTVPQVDTETAQVRVCTTFASNTTCDTGGPFAIDSTPPRIAAHEPPDGQAGVPLDAPIVVTFSERMHRQATESAFAITPTVPVTGFDWAANDTVLTIRLDPLAPATFYTWSLNCAARDVSDPGNPLAGCQEVHTFTTEGGSSLRLLSPRGGESWTGGSLHAVALSLTNGDPNDTTFAVLATYRFANGTQGGTVGALNVTVPAQSTVRLQFDWTVPRVDATDAVVNATATGGNQTLADESAPFELDSTKPTVLTFGPTGPQVPVDPTVSVRLSEPVRPPPNAFFAIRGPPGVPAVSWTLVWSTPRDGFDAALRGTRPCTTYTVSLGVAPLGALRDDSDPGNLLDALEWTFTTVCSPSVNLLAPTGGEDWTGGTAHDVRWTTEDGDDAALNATFAYSADGGQTWTPITTLVVAVGPGTYPWAVPTIDTNRALVRIVVTDGAGNTAAATSGPFTIDSTPPELLVSFPSDGGSGHKTTRDIWFVFTERVDRTSFERAFSLAPNPGGLGFLWSLSNLGGDVLVVEHSPFKSRTAYTATFGTTAKDDSDPGNALPAPIVVRFSTQPPPPVNPPVAKAVGKNQVQAGEPVTLDGSRSTGDIVRYVWRILDNQQRFVAVLTGETATYTFHAHGRYSVTLIVTDSNGATDEDTIEINVTSNPNAGLVLGAGIAFVAALAAATEAGKYSLFGWILFPLYARRKRNELLEHETRGMIFGYVLVHPGDTYTDLKRNLQLTNGTLSYHLRVLEREGLIRSASRGVHKHFYPTGANVPEDGGGLHEVQIRMLRAVREVPGLAVRDLAGALGITSQHALYHLRALAAAGEVRLERRGVRLRCYPAERPRPPDPRP